MVSDGAHRSAGTGLEAVCAQAMQLQLVGQTDRAVQLYREVLTTQPTHALANHCLGMLQVQLRRPAEGLPFLVAALNEQPTVSDYWLGYLDALLLAGRSVEAGDTLELARRHGLGGPAVEAFAKRLEAAPGRRAQPPVCGQEDALLALVEQGRLAEARTLACAMTEEFPEHGPGWKTLGALLWAQGSRDAAVAALRNAVRLLPDDAEAHGNFGAAMLQLGELTEAQRHLDAAVKIRPNPAAHRQLAQIHVEHGQLAEAATQLRAAIALAPDSAGALAELTEVQWLAGENDLAAASLRRVIQIDPHNAQARSTLLVLMTQDAGVDADVLFAEHRRFGRLLEAPLRAAWPRHRNVLEPERTLQIGLVSGDFRNHAVAGYLEPVLERLREQPDLELHAYSNNTVEDAVTTRLRGHVAHWHSVAALADGQLSGKISADGIDILIDLSGHSALNRLPVFARKPAPLQAGWIGYPGTSGLQAMDYYLADPHFLPPGRFDGQFTEKLLYLPSGGAFLTHPGAAAVNELPALTRGHITFGSFNRINKLNAVTLELWCHLLRALPGSRMLLGGMPADQQHSRLARRFAAFGIGPERLTFHARCGMAEYLALHHQVDLCLDTTPYTGGTTSIHAVSMGVPTLTLAGPTPASRGGAAILGQLAVADLTAATPAQFVALGRHWAANFGALAALRAGLRARLEHCPGRNPRTLAVAFGQAMRHMWRRHCASLPPHSFHSPAAETVHAR